MIRRDQPQERRASAADIQTRVKQLTAAVHLELQQLYGLIESEYTRVGS